MRAHPSIEIVARDRAGAYSEAVDLALPAAQQVSDRWHLLSNLRDNVERLLARSEESRANSQHRRSVLHFDRWLKRLSCCDAEEMRRFAQSLSSDVPAVRAAFKLLWSNGQTEGHVNRLKLLKRQMYGRANMELLRLRVLKPN
ncbi:transposase [Cupriavidus necator]|uniref:transposase n=1 Tax=Cupriavidus necator TaxID=106590 RepID=UPI000039EC6F|nr:transposase [Cupriavidus necator]